MARVRAEFGGAGLEVPLELTFARRAVRAADAVPTATDGGAWPEAGEGRSTLDRDEPATDRGVAPNVSRTRRAMSGTAPGSDRAGRADGARTERADADAASTVDRGSGLGNRPPERTRAGTTSGGLSSATPAQTHAGPRDAPDATAADRADGNQLPAGRTADRSGALDAGRAGPGATLAAPTPTSRRASRTRRTRANEAPGGEGPRGGVMSVGVVGNVRRLPRVSKRRLALPARASQSSLTRARAARGLSQVRPARRTTLPGQRGPVWRRRRGIGPGRQPNRPLHQRDEQARMRRPAVRWPVAWRAAQRRASQIQQCLAASARTGQRVLVLRWWRVAAGVGERRGTAMGSS